MLVVVCMNVEDTLIKAWTKIEDRTCLLQGESLLQCWKKMVKTFGPLDEFMYGYIIYSVLGGSYFG